MDLFAQVLKDPDSIGREERHYFIYAGSILASFEMMYAVMVQAMTYLITNNDEVEGLRILRQIPRMQFMQTLKYYRKLHEAKFGTTDRFEEFWSLANRANEIRIITAHSFPSLWPYADGRLTLIRQVEGRWMIRTKDQPRKTLEEFRTDLQAVITGHNASIVLFEQVIRNLPLG